MQPSSQAGSLLRPEPAPVACSAEVCDYARRLLNLMPRLSWGATWGAEQLTGMDVFAEGLAILRRFIAEQGVVDHRDVLAIEKEFRLPVGPFDVLGFIDRID
jgi:hypothetical protein